MKLAATVLATLAGSAHATTFEEYANKRAPAPAQSVYEAACDLEVHLQGAVASIEQRQKIVNGGGQPLAFIYEHVLPEGAVVSGFALRTRAGIETAIAVPEQFRTEAVESADILGPDPAVMKKTGDGRYEITVQPIEPDHDVTLVTKYVMLATPRAGALRVVMPGRQSAGKLAACKGTLRVTPGPSTTVQRIRVAGIDVGKPAAVPFAVETANVWLDVELEVAGKQPVVWAQTQALGGGWNASLVTVLAPRIKAAGARRVVFVVDGSRSMEVVGRQTIARVIKALGAALPAGAEVEAIVYDRTASRVFNDVKPANPQNLALIEDAIAKRPTANGSDIVKAFELAKQVITGLRGQAMVIVITDGVHAELPERALIDALASKTSQVDVHAIVLDPARTRSPGAKDLRAPVNLYGGAYVEVNVDELDDAMIAIDEWMRPSWLELALDTHEIPSEVRSGAGFTKLAIHKGPPRFVLTGHGDAAFKVAARPVAAGGLGALAIARAEVGDFVDDEAAPTAAFTKALAAYPSAEHGRALVVLASAGRIAKDRRAMIAGGGRYERVVAIADPTRGAPPLHTGTQSPATPIARQTLERLFRDQLHPKAYVCYQKALGMNAKLAGTVQFTLRLGRGEVTEVHVKGIGDAQLDACLADAAFAMTPPLPDFAVNADDQTIANYPLTFSRREDKGVVVAGDADSESPIDIDSIEGGVPTQPKKKVKVDAKTPLGGMKAPKGP